MSSPYSRVEETSRDPVERPGIDQEREAVDERDVDDRVAARGAAAGDRRARGLVEDHQLRGVGHPEEEERADELARGGDQVSLEGADVTGLPMVAVTADPVPSGGLHCS